MIAKKRLQDELPAYALALLQRMHKVRGQIGDENFKFVSESISICGSPRVTLKALLEIKSKLFDIMGSLERIEAKNAALDAFNKNMMVE